MDDAEIGAGGLLIQAARAGHRVVIVTVCGNLSSWGATNGREEKTKQALTDLARKFGYEKRFLPGNHHETRTALPGEHLPVDGPRTMELQRRSMTVVELLPDWSDMVSRRYRWSAVIDRRYSWATVNREMRLPSDAR